MLSRLVSTMKQSPSEATSTAQEEFSRLLLLAHYSSLRDQCVNVPELLEIKAKLCVSLLRYIGDIPADKAFYEAGLACKEVKWLSLASVFWNRFLDISDMMEDDSSAYLDNTDFVGSDIPYDFAMPTESSVGDQEREDVRNWVLAASIDQSHDAVCYCISYCYNISLTLPSYVIDAEIFSYFLIFLFCFSH